MQFGSFIFSLFKGLGLLFCKPRPREGRFLQQQYYFFFKDPGIGPSRRVAAGTRMLPELAFVFFVPKILAALAEGSRPP